MAQMESGGIEYIIHSDRAMNTEFQFVVYPREGDENTGDIARIAREAFDSIHELEELLSRWRPSSQISRVNRTAAREPARVSPEVFNVVRSAKEVYSETGGAFDITVGPLLELWGFYEKDPRDPGNEAIERVLGVVGMDLVELDMEERAISFAKEGVRLDFGGIGKGLALDEAAEYMRMQGVTSALLHGGTSSMVAIGAPPSEPGWKVRVKHPYNEEESIDEVLLCDGSLSTSGGGARYSRMTGEGVCHILDPRSGRPVEGMLFATALASKGTLSDALSTAFFVMGEARTEAYCRAHPGVRAILVPVPESGQPRAKRIGFEAREE